MGQRAVTVKECDRCFKNTLATTTVRYSVGDVDYEFDACETHADMFQREMSGWTRISREKERATFFGRSKVELENHRRTTVERRERTRPATPEERPPIEHPVVKKTWYLTQHAEERLEERGPLFGFTRRDVFLCAQAPESVEPAEGDDRWLHVRGNVALIVDRVGSSIVTVMPAEFREKQEALSGYSAG